MTGYDYLMQPRRIDYKIRRLQIQVTELESCLLPQAIRYDKDKVQTSPEDQLSRIAARISDLSRESNRLARKKAELVIEISDEVEALADDTEKAVLMGYFIARKSMKEVAEQIHYTIRGAYKVRARAVRHFESVHKVHTTT